MIISLGIMLVVTILAAAWARRLARARRRHVSAWSLATALFPPFVLVLWALPNRSIPTAET